MQKNVGSQKIALLAIDVSTNAPKTGDAANLTAYVSKDWGAVTVLGDTSATEMDATNAPGMYVFDLTQAETNADELQFTGKSSTANVKIIPRIIQTVPANFSTLTIANSCVDADLERIAGSAVSTSTAQLGVNVVNFGGSAGTFSSGRPEVNTTHAAGTAWNSGAIGASTIANGAIDAATFAADVGAEILSYIVDDATRIDASALNTASVTSVPAILADTNELQTDWVNGGRLDLLIDAIKAKTDSLTFTVSGMVDANIQYVNDVQIAGTGVENSDEWRPV